MNIIQQIKQELAGIKMIERGGEQHAMALPNPY